MASEAHEEIRHHQGLTEAPGSLDQPSAPPPSSYGDARHYPNGHSARFCKELLRCRLQQIQRIEEKLAKLTKYSLKLQDTQEELVTLLASEKEDTIRLAAAAGASSHDSGYDMSYAVVLEQCRNILLEKE